MRVFYQAFPIRDALRHELSWTHYRTLIKIEDEAARSWYMAEAAAQGWTPRALGRQINTLYYKRLLATSNRSAVEQEAMSLLHPCRRLGTLSVTRCCWSSLVCQVSVSSWRQIWSERCSTTCRLSFWSLGACSPS